ncbi:MAG: hypothetical protein ACRD4L_00195, partial [Pyrinomonadaceae bacterium]
TNTVNHESGVVDSHWSHYRDAQNIPSNNLGLVTESQTAPPGVTDAAFSGQVQGEQNKAITRIESATAVEPCGGNVNSDSNQGCRFFGNVNFTNQSCGTQPTPLPTIAPQLYWSFAGPIEGKNCLQISEPSDPNAWHDNFLCTDQNFGFRWSFVGGPIPGMVNIQWLEPSDPHGWHDNFLATPIDYGYQWSFAGPIPGKQCLQISEPSDPNAWHDNYICW